MKVQKDKTADYLEVEKLWKAIHVKRLERGLITAWYLCRVDNPPEASRDYQYVTVALCDSFAKLEDPFPSEVFAAAYPNQNPSEYGKKTQESRDLIRSEVWDLEDAAMSDTRPWDDSGHIRIDYLQPAAGKEGEYVRMETKIFHRLHQERIKRGLMNGWFLLSRRFPGGSEVPFQYITVNASPSEEKASESPADLVSSAFSEEEVKSWGALNVGRLRAAWRKSPRYLRRRHRNAAGRGNCPAPQERQSFSCHG